MNQNNMKRQADTDLFFDEADVQGSGSSGIHLQSLLRGRYHWAIILGLILAICGALAGFYSQGDVYRSSSLIGISPIRQGIFTQDYARNYDSWISRQLTIMSGPKVLEPAMSSDEWQTVAVGPYRSSTVLFANGLKLDHKRGQEVIEISYESPIPELAQAGANAITKAYMSELERSEQQDETHVMSVLEDRRLDLVKKIEHIKSEKRKLFTEHNEHTIKDVLERLTAARDKLEAELEDTRLQLADLGVSTDNEANPEQLTLEQLAAHNRPLAELLARRESLETQIDYMKRLGRGDRHPEMKDATASLDALNTQIERLARSLRGSIDGSFSAENQDEENVSPIVALRAKERRLTKQHENASAEVQHLAMIYGQMETLNADLKAYQDDLSQTVTRLDNLQIESQASGRAQVLSGDAGLPTEPYNTGKRKQLAALGGMAGLCGGFGLVILWGLMDRRLRHIEDAQAGLGGYRMLGVLPELPDDLTNPEQAVLASHCVHQVRTLLQINRGENGFVLSVTGPAAGSGKTSLTMALGMSFASSSSKTLLIDCDIVGGGLTRRLLQGDRSDKHSGVLEACNGTAFSDCIIHTSIPNLDMVPIGSALPSQAGNLSPSAVKKLLAKARDEYETVLVDTGPVLGSLEASMVSAQADKTIVIVSRGDQKPIILKSLDHLRSIGANIAGIVFNHADAVDIERSTYASVTVSQNRRMDDRELNEVQWIDRDTSDRYGPLATAVASYGRARDDSDHTQSQE